METYEAENPMDDDRADRGRGVEPQAARGATVSSTQEPAHLNNHHRNTLAKIFEHPVSHNVEWRAVLSLLQVTGSVEERHDGKFVVTLGTETEVLERPRHRDIDAQEVVDLRRMLRSAGYGPSPSG